MTTIIFSGHDQVTCYQTIALKHGLKFFVKTGIRPNSAWTPTAMMKLAAHLTGRTFKPRDYAGAIAALERLVG